MGRYLTTAGTSSATTRVVSTTYSAVVNDRVLCTTGGFTITLPGSGLLDGDTIQIIDVNSVFGSSNLTVARNGQLIGGLAENLVLDVSGAIVTLVYTGVTYGWVLTSV